MDKKDKMIEGYWSVAAEKHLKNYTDESQNLDEVDNLNIAGKAGRFLGTIRGNGNIENVYIVQPYAAYSGSEWHHIKRNGKLCAECTP